MEREREDSLTGPLTITEMTLADLDEVHQVEQQSFPTPWSRKAFWCELTQNIYAHYVVARIDNVLVGYAGMWVILDEAHVTNIAVHPAYRRRGIGRRILTELMERAKSRGATRMTLEVRKSNEGAQRLYREMGFVARGIRKGYYADLNEDAIIMWKDDLCKPKPRWQRMPWFGAGR
ncbi:MAG: ribosomal protein S18-alanine N-acetyltransferase [Firmicutes bacterium]|nr:ribosomal protein S18-alanine N-acetyltransferase [Bacillota bacterium]